MSDVECPYCGTDQEIDHGDGYGYGEDQTYHQECSDCGKIFVYTTSISYYYEAEKADCLNEGGKHNMQPTYTIPRKYTRMICSMCDGEERECTKEEMAAILKADEDRLSKK